MVAMPVNEPMIIPASSPADIFGPVDMLGPSDGSPSVLVVDDELLESLLVSGFTCGIQERAFVSLLEHRLHSRPASVLSDKYLEREVFQHTSVVQVLK